ncbi:hypothetical protein [Pluralibacter sp.]|uniref:hypothetical protein n=1 Tax=Pluralibacter sp. TaxID=1920032 RepID=UPI0025EF9444|nr:hypothetical protein [Pluralibacter sp.]
MTISSDADTIANRIADMILSPETIEGMINGALTVPLDLGYLAVGYFNTDSRFSHQTMRIRMAEVIHNDILSYDHITHAANIVFNEFNKRLTTSQQDNIYRHAASSVTGRISATQLLSVIGAAV